MLRRSVCCFLGSRMAVSPQSTLLARATKAAHVPPSVVVSQDADWAGQEDDVASLLPDAVGRGGKTRPVTFSSEFMRPTLSSSSMRVSGRSGGGGGRGGLSGSGGEGDQGRPRRAKGPSYAHAEGEVDELNVAGPVVTPFAETSGELDTVRAVEEEDGDGLDAAAAASRTLTRGRGKKAAALASSGRRLVMPPRPPAGSVYDMDDEAGAAPRARLGDDVSDAKTGSSRRGAKSGTSSRTSASGSTNAVMAAREDDVSAESEDSVPTLVGTPGALSNPFLGLHDLMARSYRLDQLIHQATDHDLLFARQERKSTAFSFLRFRAGTSLYEQHWASLPQLHSLLSSLQGSSYSSSPSAAGTPIPGLSLFNNDLGLASPLVQSSYPLIIAQRLLLFPDHVRHFHTLCGREDVPCDFYADVDLDGESAASGEQVLLEILNYLEVRLPGIGFTDPFFLILANEVPSADKVSYHIHARSMTYLKERAEMPLSRRDLGVVRGGAKSSSSSRSSRRSRQRGAATNEADGGEVHEEEEAEDEEEEKDHMHEGSTTKAKTSSSSSVPKVIAFQDYRTVKLLADEVNQTLGRTVIDDHCYRAHGMLRCAFSAKLNSNQNLTQRNRPNDPRRRLMPLLRAKDCALQDKLRDMEAVLRTMTDPEILELSFVNRYLDEPAALKRVHEHVKTLCAASQSSAAGRREERESLLRATTRHRFRLLRPRQISGPQAAQAQEYDSYGNVVSPFLTEAAKWRRFKTVVAKLRALPPRAAEPYDVWVRVGLALHNFSNEDHVFDEWVRFSLKCPQKYSREMCRKKWVQFERNPDALNWRRGFNYLNSTVWRQV